MSSWHLINASPDPCSKCRVQHGCYAASSDAPASISNDAMSSAVNADTHTSRVGAKDCGEAILAASSVPCIQAMEYAKVVCSYGLCMYVCEVDIFASACL